MCRVCASDLRVNGILVATRRSSERRGVLSSRHKSDDSGRDFRISIAGWQCFSHLNRAKLEKASALMCQRRPRETEVQAPGARIFSAWMRRSRLRVRTEALSARCLFGETASRSTVAQPATATSQVVGPSKEWIKRRLPGNRQTLVRSVFHERGPTRGSP
jgi:hypothetical protein